MSDERSEGITITAPGLWIFHEGRPALVATRLDAVDRSWPGLDNLVLLELMLLEARLKYALARVQYRLKAEEATDA